LVEGAAVLVTRKNGHKESDSEDEFPVKELPKGKRCSVTLRNGGIWQVIVQEAHSAFLIVEGGFSGRGTRIEDEQVKELKLFW